MVGFVLPVVDEIIVDPKAQVTGFLDDCNFVGLIGVHGRIREGLAHTNEAFVFAKIAAWIVSAIGIETVQ